MSTSRFSVVVAPRLRSHANASISLLLLLFRDIRFVRMLPMRMNFFFIRIRSVFHSRLDNSFRRLLRFQQFFGVGVRDRYHSRSVIRLRIARRLALKLVCTRFERSVGDLFSAAWFTSGLVLGNHISLGKTLAGFKA